MKAKFILIVSVFLFSIACEEVDTKGLDIDSFEDKSVLTISLSGVKNTRATASSFDYEDQVNSVEVFVFTDDGRLENSAYSTSVSAVSLLCSYGSKEIFAAVNFPQDRFSDVRRIDDLKLATRLSDNSISKSQGFVMGGMVDAEIESEQVMVTIPVSRYVARVVLERVTNRLPSSLGEMTIDWVAISNVFTFDEIYVPLGLTTAREGKGASYWENRFGRVQDISSGNLGSLIYRTVGYTLQSASVYTSPYYFYGYSNYSASADQGFSANWTERPTRLVLAATIGGTQYYYPVNITPLERNKSYSVSMSISNLGSTDPDILVSREAMDMAVSVSVWEPGSTYTETI